MVVVYVSNNEYGTTNDENMLMRKLGISDFVCRNMSHLSFRLLCIYCLCSKSLVDTIFFFSEIIFHFILTCLTTIRLSFKATRRRTWSFVRSGRKMKIYFKTKNGNSFAMGSTQKTQWKKSQIKSKTKIGLKVKFPTDHSFNIYANVCVSRGSKCQLFRKFCVRTKWMIPHATVKET